MERFWKLRCSKKSARCCGARFEVKMYKTPQLSMLGKLKSAWSCGVKHVWKSKCWKRLSPEHFWKLRCSKSALHSGAKHISKSKCAKHTTVGPLLEVQASFCMAGAMDSARCQKWLKRGFCSSCKNDAGRGTFEALQRCISRGRRSTSEIFIRDVGRFLRGVASWSIRSSGLPNNLAWQVQHFVWPGLTFSWPGEYFREMGWKKSQSACRQGH